MARLALFCKRQEHLFHQGPRSSQLKISPGFAKITVGGLRFSTCKEDARWPAAALIKPSRRGGREANKETKPTGVAAGARGPSPCWDVPPHWHLCAVHTETHWDSCSSPGTHSHQQPLFGLLMSPCKLRCPFPAWLSLSWSIRSLVLRDPPSRNPPQPQQERWRVGRGIVTVLWGGCSSLRDTVTPADPFFHHPQLCFAGHSGVALGVPVLPVPGCSPSSLCVCPCRHLRLSRQTRCCSASAEQGQEPLKQNPQRVGGVQPPTQGP